jgi:hypothetical protein
MAEPIRITQTVAGSVPLRTRDGVPVCAYCNETMVEIDEEFWECPIGRADLEAAIDRLCELIDEALAAVGEEETGTYLRSVGSRRVSPRGTWWRRRPGRPCRPSG